jgi:parvulin-like peptidyl-prolyl isomerase
MVLPVGTWSGPVSSGYGQHLVFVSAIRPGEMRRFEDVRGAVLDDWRREKTAEARKEYLARLRDKYGVVVDQDALSQQGRVAESQARL